MMRWFERHRLEWIAERVAAVGYINRRDLMEQFDVSMPQASKDLQTFMRQMPDTLVYDASAKRYAYKGDLPPSPRPEIRLQEISPITRLPIPRAEGEE